MPIDFRPTEQNCILFRYKLFTTVVGNFILMVSATILLNRAHIHPAVITTFAFVDLNGGRSLLPGWYFLEHDCSSVGVSQIFNELPLIFTVLRILPIDNELRIQSITRFNVIQLTEMFDPRHVMIGNDVDVLLIHFVGHDCDGVGIT